MRLLAIFGILFLCGCGSQIRNASDDCKEYYRFLKQNWIPVSAENKLCGFKGNPEFWFTPEKYFKGECLLKLTEKQIEGLLGKPQKAYIFRDFQVWYYCMTDACLNSMQNSGKELIINFDSTRTVTQIDHNPVGVDTSH